MVAGWVVAALVFDLAEEVVTAQMGAGQPPPGILTDGWGVADR